MSFLAIHNDWWGVSKVWHWLIEIILVGLFEVDH